MAFGCRAAAQAELDDVAQLGWLQHKPLQKLLYIYELYTLQYR